MKEKQRPELMPSDELVRKVKSEVDDLILYFSCGKDSIAMWLFLRDKGFTIYQFIFIRYLVYGQTRKISRIMRAILGNTLCDSLIQFYSMLRDMVYQPEEWHKLEHLICQTFGLKMSMPQYLMATNSIILMPQWECVWRIILTGA